MQCSNINRKCHYRKKKCAHQVINTNLKPQTHTVIKDVKMDVIYRQYLKAPDHKQMALILQRWMFNILD